MKVISCTDSAVQGNDFELIRTIRMERGHSVEGPFSRDFLSFYSVRELSRSEVGSRSGGYQKVRFVKKTIPCGKILKISFRKDSPSRRSTSCVQISWNLADRKSVKSCVIYLTKKNQKIGSRSRSRFCADRTQNLSGLAPDNILGVPKFYPNPFTSGGVIAERVNFVQTCHKVFAIILGEASASSPRKYTHMCSHVCMLLSNNPLERVHTPAARSHCRPQSKAKESHRPSFTSRTK